jgi:hypothetical protein
MHACLCIHHHLQLQLQFLRIKKHSDVIEGEKESSPANKVKAVAATMFDHFKAAYLVLNNRLKKLVDES